MAARKAPAKKAASKVPAKTDKPVTIEELADEEFEVADDTPAYVKHREIVKRRDRKESWEHISKKVGMNVRSCMKVYREKRDVIRADMVQQRDQVQKVQEFIARYDGWMEQLADLADESDGGVKTQAIGQMVTIQRDIITLSQSTGLLPANLGDLRQTVNARQTAQKIMAVLREHEAPDELMQAMYEALTGERLLIEHHGDDEDDEVVDGEIVG